LQFAAPITFFNPRQRWLVSTWYAVVRQAMRRTHCTAQPQTATLAFDRLSCKLTSSLLNVRINLVFIVLSSCFFNEQMDGRTDNGQIGKTRNAAY